MTSQLGHVFAIFGPTLPGPGPQANELHFWLKFLLETKLWYASLEPLSGFLAYLEPKLWAINKKLVNIFTPTKA